MGLAAKTHAAVAAAPSLDVDLRSVVEHDDEGNRAPGLATESR
jgi:hypothetical protein